MKRLFSLVLAVLMLACFFGVAQPVRAEENVTILAPDGQLVELRDGLYVARFEGNDGFDQFLSAGGAASDNDVVNFLNKAVRGNPLSLATGKPFGCSTAAAVSPDGHAVFGRNLDVEGCNGLILESHPTDAYASISTVNLNYLYSKIKGFPDPIAILATHYAPVDGMNEKGLCVAVNAINEKGDGEQFSGKTGITTTTMVRLLLNQAANVSEALELMAKYDFHPSYGANVHFALSDRTGRCVCVEYVNHEMSILETPVVTNHYLTPSKGFAGQNESAQRFDILVDILDTKEGTLSLDEMRDAMSKVAKSNFKYSGQITEWSIVYDQVALTASYYHREDYANPYFITLGE